MELCIRSAGGTRHCLDITCAAPLTSSPPLYHLSTPYPLSVTPRTTIYFHLNSTSKPGTAKIQFTNESALRGGELLVFSLGPYQGGVWGLLGCVFEGMSQRVSEVPEGVEGMPKT